MKTRSATILSFVLTIFFFWQNTALGKTLPNILDEIDPEDPNIEEMLEYYDDEYFKATGESPFIDEGPMEKGRCYRNSCPIWAEIRKDQQMLYLYVNGAVKYVWLVSTGVSGYTTPDMDLHPNGRIYDRYTSTKYPDGDYNGLGNMPYAVFLRGGYAIHGTTRGNWSKLGRPASHGCIRLHPNNGFIFNRLVRSHGTGSVWVSID